jgi:multidrug resistance efflux pump
MVTSTQDVTSAAFAQLQQQLAQRNAEQAEQRARNLQSQTRQAKAEADRAQERARSLEVQTDQARNEADRVRSGLAASESIREVQTQLGELSTSIRSAFPPEGAAESSDAPAPVVNAQGQLTGTLINTSA